MTRHCTKSMDPLGSPSRKMLAQLRFLHALLSMPTLFSKVLRGSQGPQETSRETDTNAGYVSASTETGPATVHFSSTCAKWITADYQPDVQSIGISGGSGFTEFACLCFFFRLVWGSCMYSSRSLAPGVFIRQATPEADATGDEGNEGDENATGTGVVQTGVVEKNSSN